MSGLISAPVENSGFLLAVSALVAVPTGISVGVVTAIRRDRLLDHALTTTMLWFASLPDFVIGVGLVLIFATGVLQVLPAVSLLPPGEHPWQHPTAVVLPAAALVLATVPYISRLMRASMIEVLESEYVTMARLNGLPERTVIWRHAVPNAMVPAIQACAIAVAVMAGGVVVTEYIFDYPGLGSTLVQAVENHDIPVVEATTLIVAALYVVLNLIADLATLWLTPKLRGPRSRTRRTMPSLALRKGPA